MILQLVGKSSSSQEVFGKDYPLEYSPDGRFLLGLTLPLQSYMADLLLMDINGQLVHTSSDPMGLKNFMFTWTTDKTFVTGSLATEGEEALRLWDVRNLKDPVFSQMTESSLGFELMDDPKNNRKWLVGVHTEKVFGVPSHGPFCGRSR